jgi:AcrR family transcriptional regulator
MSTIKATSSVVYATKGAELAQKMTKTNETEPPEPSDDLRVRRTRKLIQQAFAELTVEKGFAALSVQDIADRAMVNRSTFYRHYLDKYDLLEKYMDDVYALAAEEERLAEKSGQIPDGVPRGLFCMLKNIQRRVDFYRVMLGPKGDPVFVQRLRANTERRFQALLANFPPDPDPNALPIDLRVSYISYAGVGAIKWWMDHQHDCTAEQLARWLGQLSSASAGFTLEEFIQRANTKRANTMGEAKQNG